MQCLFKKPALLTIACILISGCGLRARSVYIVFKLFLQMIQMYVVRVVMIKSTLYIRHIPQIPCIPMTHESSFSNTAVIQLVIAH